MHTADFIAETANNPGTGSFTLNGATAGRRWWSSAYANGDRTPYSATDGSGNWETGLGTLSVSSGNPTVMARTQIFANSQGSTSPINFTGSLFVYSSVPAALMPVMETDGSLRILGSPVRTEANMALVRNVLGDNSNISNRTDSNDANNFQMGQGIYLTATSPRVSFDLTFRAWLDGGNYAIQASDRVVARGRVTLYQSDGKTEINHLDDISDVMPGMNGKIFVPFTYAQLTVGNTYVLVPYCSIQGTNNAAVRLGTNYGSTRFGQW